jgi:hypothetical protein
MAFTANKLLYIGEYIWIWCCYRNLVKMATSIFHQGFPTNCPAGKLSREVIDTIVKNIEIKYPDQTNYVICTSLTDSSVVREAIKLDPDNIFIVATESPWLFDWHYPIENLEFFNGITKPTIHKINYKGDEYHFDFSAIQCAKFFRKYQEDELDLKDPKYVFVNYNRKPSEHRIQLFEKLHQEGLADKGILTISSYVNDKGETVEASLNEDFNDYREWGAYDEPTTPWQDYTTPNDIYSLGRMDIWQSHFVNVVSEGRFDLNNDMFVSEKIWKPIIGMRPFMINNTHQLYDHLEKNGFDTFRDIWPIPYDQDEEEPWLATKEVHDYIINNLKWVERQNLKELYQDIRPRLLANRKRFFEHAQEQKKVLENLFL